MVPGSKRKYSCLYLDILKEDWQQEKTFLSLSLSTRWCLAAREDILVFISDILEKDWQQEQTFLSLSLHSCLYLCVLDGAWQQEKIFLSLSLSTRWCLAAREDILVSSSLYTVKQQEKSIFFSDYSIY
jgi:hypothetical protein